MSAEDAMDALRRRYKERVGEARRGQAKRHADNAALAMEAKDPVAAANAYRLAVTLLPEDEALKASFDNAQSAADVILSESYGRQALYEEKNEDWVGSAKSWAKVAKARAGDAKAHERAAAAMVKANADMHEAAKLGARAVALEPNNSAYRVTLATVYLHAGLPKNARRELETAVKLSPDDANIQTLLKRAQKGV
jgi:predicted Zn-dependent protease